MNFKLKLTDGRGRPISSNTFAKNLKKEALDLAKKVVLEEINQNKDPDTGESLKVVSSENSKGEPSIKVTGSEEQLEALKKKLKTK